MRRRQTPHSTDCICALIYSFHTPLCALCLCSHQTYVSLWFSLLPPLLFCLSPIFFHLKHNYISMSKYERQWPSHAMQYCMDGGLFYSQYKIHQQWSTTSWFYSSCMTKWKRCMTRARLLWESIKRSKDTVKYFCHSTWEPHFLISCTWACTLLHDTSHYL